MRRTAQEGLTAAARQAPRVVPGPRAGHRLAPDHTHTEDDTAPPLSNVPLDDPLGTDTSSVRVTGDVAGWEPVGSRETVTTR